ncbi:histidine kinase [Maritimibacter sp. 55A14]|uniref:CBS domain-containing protein n=1 Tax=Maritimibacter sp. 55A14 TaxID=2174844 RepID=UPI000D605D16|nr:CBS domain-containing protein [Maritimibacter sp. 55A14]PWE28785.1 histidine kinase [Maritimibacter sp. 55A14]
MIVRQILKLKSSNEVATIPPSATVREAAEILSAKRIGAVIVSADGKVPEGILSERDIVRELGQRGPGCMSQCVIELMTAELVGCTLDETSDHVLARMTEGRFRHMPVMEDGKMAGLISIGDVVKARLAELSMEKDALQGMIMGR